jgi:hypothetical protein
MPECGKAVAWRIDGLSGAQMACAEKKSPPEQTSDGLNSRRRETQPTHTRDTNTAFCPMPLALVWFPTKVADMT